MPRKSAYNVIVADVVVGGDVVRVVVVVVVMSDSSSSASAASGGTRVNSDSRLRTCDELDGIRINRDPQM